LLIKALVTHFSSGSKSQQASSRSGNSMMKPVKSKKITRMEKKELYNFYPNPEIMDLSLKHWQETETPSM